MAACYNAAMECGASSPVGRREWILVALALAAFGALCIAGVVDRSYTTDEGRHLRYGRQLLAGDATRFDDAKMPVLHELLGV